MDKSIFLKLLTSSNEKSLPPIEDINGLKTTQQKIQEHIQQLVELNQKYHKKQEQSFLIAFTGVMDKMAQELLKAKRKYEDIDTEIRRHQICSKLEKELMFFKRDNSELREQIASLRQENKSVREKNEELKSTILALKNTLKSRSSVLDRARGQKVKSRMSVCHTRQDEISIPELSTKTVKNLDFRSHRRAQSNLSRRLDTVLKTRVLKDSSFQTQNLDFEIRALWRAFKFQYPDYETIRSKTRGKIVDQFVGSPAIKKMVKRVLLDGE